MRNVLLLLLLLPIWGWGQSPTLTAAWRVGAAGYEQGFEVAIDNPGHVVVAGYFEGTVDFDPGAGTQNRASSGLHDIFVAKYTSTGTYEWAFRVGGAGYDQATGVDVDASGNVFVSGYFTGTVDFDPGAGTTTLNAGSADDAFLAKYSPTGTLLWAIKVGGSGYDMSNSCAVDANGDVFLTGHFVGTVDFNPGAGTNNLVSAGSMDMYLAKYSGAAGAYIWALRVGASGFNDDSGYDLATFGTDVYVTGLWSGTVDFDPGAGTVSRTGAGGNDIFLLKFNSAGTFQWVYTGGSAESDESTGVDVDALGNVYLAGSFGLTVDFDPSASVFNLTSAGVGDVFVAKYTPTGSLTWAKRIGSVTSQHSWGMAASPDGNTFFTGFLQMTGDFDPNAGVYNVTSAGDFDSYLGSLDANGNFRFAFPIGDVNMDVGYGVDVNDACELAITGYFAGTTDMDPQATVANLTSAGGFDAYVAVYGACAPLPMEALALTAEPLVDGRVALSWAGDAGEYAVRRSADGLTWETLLATNAPTAIDPAPFAREVHYQVEALLPDGGRLRSNVVTVTVEAAGLRLWPSLAHTEVQLCVPERLRGAPLRLHDAHGRLLWQGKADGPQMQIDVTGLAAGMYFLQVGNEVVRLQRR